MKRYVICKNGGVFDLEDITPSRNKVFADKPLSPKMIERKIFLCGGEIIDSDTITGLMQEGDLYEVKCGKEYCTMMAVDNVLKQIDFVGCNTVRLFKRLNENTYKCFAYRGLKDKDFTIMKEKK